MKSGKKAKPIQKAKKEESGAGLFLDTPVDWAKIKKKILQKVHLQGWRGISLLPRTWR